jgi:sphingomyelin phosphodiesterase acid-like 3
MAGSRESSASPDPIDGALLQDDAGDAGGILADLEMHRPSSEKRSKWRIAIAIFLGFAILVTVLTMVLVAFAFFTQSAEFIYVNDIHLDPLYDPYAYSMNIDPDASQACRVRDPNATVTFPFGQYGCDSPRSTFESMLAHWPTVTKDPDFILFGGDSIGHSTGYNRSGVQSIFSELITKMSAVYPNKPILVTLGNNDFVPNYGIKGNDTLDFASIGEVMKRFMNDEQYETFQKGGYYYQDLGKRKLRLLLLNTVTYAYRRGYWGEDPYDQFAWIEKTAQDGHSKGYKVGIAMHIPAGVSYIGTTQGWPTEYVSRFDDICKKNDILFTLAGHTHYDMLMPVFGDDGASKGYSLSSPSISLSHSNNPAWRLMIYDENGIRDIHQYYAEVLMNPQDNLRWELEYKFSDAYSVKELSVDNLLKVVKWVTETGEGMWRYKERVGARASENGAFYYCILKATTTEQIDHCMSKVAQPRSRANLLPYNDEV